MAAEDHGGGDDGALALEVDGVVRKHERLYNIGGLTGFKSGCDDHESLKQTTVHPQAADAVARDDAEADDKFVARLFLTVGKARGAQVVEHEFKHFEVF